MKDTGQGSIETIDAYIAAQAPASQERLRALRALIGELAPDATERMAYGLPTWFLNGNLVHIGAFAKHTGLYPGAAGVAAFEAELGVYERSKGAIRFPLDQPLPMDLIARIVRLRVEQNRALPKKRAPKPKA